MSSSCGLKPEHGARSQKPQRRMRTQCRDRGHKKNTQQLSKWCTEEPVHERQDVFQMEDGAEQLWQSPRGPPNLKYSWPLDNVGVRSADPPLSRFSMSGPPWSGFLQIQGSASVGSADRGPCRAVVFSVEKNPHVSQPTELKLWRSRVNCIYHLSLWRKKRWRVWRSRLGMFREGDLALTASQHRYWIHLGGGQPSDISIWRLEILLFTQVCFSFVLISLTIKVILFTFTS